MLQKRARFSAIYRDWEQRSILICQSVPFLLRH